MHLTFILFIIVLLESVFAYYSTECITLFTFLIVIKHVDIHFLENKDTKSSLHCALLCIIKIVQTYISLGITPKSKKLKASMTQKCCAEGIL